MKKSTLLTIAIALGALFTLTAANLKLKQVYDGIDKSNPFWNYEMLQSGSFSHVKVLDKRSTWVVFRPSPHGSVGILGGFEGQHRLETSIAHDTLFVHILPHDDEPGQRDWISRTQLVCVTGPQLKSITGENLSMTVKDLNEKNLSATLTGDSRLEVESLTPDFDSVSVSMRDSSEMKIEMAEEIHSTGVLTAGFLKADLDGKCFLDAGRLRIGKLEKNINDTSAIALSGATIATLKKAN